MGKYDWNQPNETPLSWAKQSLPLIILGCILNEANQLLARKERNLWNFIRNTHIGKRGRALIMNCHLRLFDPILTCRSPWYQCLYLPAPISRPDQEMNFSRRLKLLWWRVAVATESCKAGCLYLLLVLILQWIMEVFVWVASKYYL